MDKVYAIENLAGPKYAAIRPFDTFGSLVSVIVQNAAIIAGVIFFVLLIFGGFGIIIGAGSGDAKRMEQGKKAITGAVIGLIIVVTSVWIVQIIGTITGIDLLTPNLNP